MRLREALWLGNIDEAALLVPSLDEDHQVEVLLGGALRHAHAGFAAVGCWRRARLQPANPAGWRSLCAALAAPAASAHDERAAGWLASGRVPETVPAVGPALPDAVLADLRGPSAEITLVTALAGGAARSAVLAAFAAHPLAPAVAAYYQGGILALGPRPLLYLTIIPPREAYAT